MKLDEKRKVIEVLLAVPGPGGSVIWYVQGYSHRTKCAAFAAWFDVEEQGGYDLNFLAAAYRLIESSPTLRTEWFGR